MSADSTGAESAAASRRWYLEVSGRRAGPFAWTVLVELAQAGALGADDRVWRMGLAGWSRAADLVDLAPLIREPAPARTFTSSGCAAPEPAHPMGYPPPSRDLRTPAACGRGPPVPHRPRGQPDLHGGLAPVRRIASRFRTAGIGVRRALSVPHRAAASRAVTVRAAGRGRSARVSPRRAGGRAQRLRRRGRRRYRARAAGRCRRRQRTSTPGRATRRCAALPIVGSIPVRRHTQTAVGAAPIRSAAALTAISPALVGLLDAPAGPRDAPAHRDAPQPPVDTSGSNTPGPGPDAPNVNPKLDCDRLLLMYDTAVAASADAGAAFVRAFQGGSGS